MCECLVLPNTHTSKTLVLHWSSHRQTHKRGLTEATLDIGILGGILVLHNVSWYLANEILLTKLYKILE